MLERPAWATLEAASARTGAALLRTVSLGLCISGIEKVCSPALAQHLSQHE